DRRTARLKRNRFGGTAVALQPTGVEQWVNVVSYGLPIGACAGTEPAGVVIGDIVATVDKDAAVRSAAVSARVVEKNGIGHGGDAVMTSHKDGAALGGHVTGEGAVDDSQLRRNYAKSCRYEDGSSHTNGSSIAGEGAVGDDGRADGAFDASAAVAGEGAAGYRQRAGGAAQRPFAAVADGYAAVAGEGAVGDGQLSAAPEGCELE